MRIVGGRRVVLLVLVGLALLIAVGIGITVGAAIASVESIDDIARSGNNELALPTILYDRNGREITQLFGDEKRTPVSIEEIPRHVVYSLLTREDREFFEHGGINVTRTVRAAFSTLAYVVTGGRAGAFTGASTITQQLAKMMYTDQSNTVRRKLVELWWALQLERHLTKYEILEEYLNRMPFGHGTYGIEAASQWYFGHPASELSVAESMMLILQLSNPSGSLYSPFVNPENAREQQKRQLDELAALGYATQEEVDQSFATYWANHDYTRSANTGAFLERAENDQAPWFSSYVSDRLQNQLLLGAANIYTDGYRVYTTLDLDYQRAAQEELWEGIQSANQVYRRNQDNRESRVDRFLPMIEMLGVGFDAGNLQVGNSRNEARARIYFRDEIAPMLDMITMTFGASEQEGLRRVVQETYVQRQQVTDRTQVEGGLITLDNDTGYILAMVGGSPFSGGQNEINRAVSARRQPGSSFKPLYYAAAINDGAVTPATVFQDIPITFWNNDGTPYTPINYNGEWNGPTRVRTALATSMNVVSIRVLDSVGFREGLGVAGRLLGLSEAQMAERGFENRYPVGLGTVSVSPLLMARAFATFPNGGREVIPVSIRYIEDRNGRTIMEPATEIAQQLANKGRAAQIISPQAAYVMTDMLQSTVEFGTLRNRSLLVGGFDGMPMGGKTGTTQNWSDAWTVGFSPYVTTAVWLGFDRGGNNSLGANQTGAQTAGPIWAWYMKRIHENMPAIEFDRPSNIVETVVTLESGLLPAEDYRGTTVEEVFIAGTQPDEFDTTQQFDDERRNRVARSLARPTTATPSSLLSALRTRSVEDEEEASSEQSGEEPDTSSENPFFSDLETEDGESEPDTEHDTPSSVNPFFADPADEDEEDSDSDSMLD